MSCDLTRDGPVFVVDSDDTVRKAVRQTLESVHIRVFDFATTSAFFAHYIRGMPGCLIADLHLPGISGTELMERLRPHEEVLPVVFLTGKDDLAGSVAVMKAGAIDVLEKPCDMAALLRSVRYALSYAALHARQNEDDGTVA